MKIDENFKLMGENYLAKSIYEVKYKENMEKERNKWLEKIKSVKNELFKRIELLNNENAELQMKIDEYEKRLGFLNIYNI